MFKSVLDGRLSGVVIVHTHCCITGKVNIPGAMGDPIIMGLMK